MAIRTTSIVPFPVTSIPDRLTPIYVTDKTIVTTTSGTGAVKRLNRLQGASFEMDTPVTEVSEMGAQNRVGGVDDLGEAKISLDFADVGIYNLAAILGKTVNATPASITNIGLADFQSATTDFFRLVGDPLNNVFGTLYLQDCVVDEYQIDVKVKGMIMDKVSLKGPNATFFPGYIVPKTYVVQTADVTANSITLTTVFGADEAPVQIYLPGAGAPPSYWQQNGSKYFLKVEQVPGASLTATPVRYYEAGAVAGQTVTYTSATKVLAFPSGKLVAGDLIRLVFCTYNTDSFPTTVPSITPDPITTDRPGVSARVIPITINALKTTRIESAAIKFSLKRDQVQGVGENSIVYGVPQIPDVTIDLQVKESDPALISILNTGSNSLSSGTGTIANDFQDLNYGTRYQLANALPFVMTINDPFSTNVLATYTTPQLVVKNIAYSSSNKADNSLKITAMDIQGLLTISFTHP